LKRYDFGYGTEQACRFDFWIANKDASQWYDEWFFAAGDPVWELRQYCALVRPGDHVLEIGCQHGFLTRQLAHLIGPTGSIVALDANPENVIIAQSNLRLIS
jgi:ubiquinone/menaquinone biosynthesis C-methylase UbiE